MHMHSHGSFASLPLIWYWEYTRNATFLTDPTLATADPTATPYALVKGLAEWWVCHLTKVIPTPLHVLDRISPIFSPFFPVFCAFSPSR